MATSWTSAPALASRCFRSTAPRARRFFVEQTGYIRAITQWVLAHAIAQCAEWRCAGLPMNVSINISTRDLMDATLPDRVAELLRRHRCSAQWISLEITESAVLDDPTHAI